MSSEEETGGGTGGTEAREHLANERTLLAWIRTGVSLISIGLAVERIGAQIGSAGALGMWGERPLVLRYGRWLRVKETDLDRAEGWFEKHGSSVVFFARLAPGARSIVSVPAGMLKMPFWRFTLLTTLGSALWNFFLIGAGWFLSANWRQVADVVGSTSDVVLLVLLVAAVVLLLRWWFHRAR